MPTIRISEEAYRNLQGLAQPFVDTTPDHAIKRLLEAAYKSLDGQCCLNINAIGKERRAGALNRTGWESFRENLVKDLRDQTGDESIRIKELKYRQFSLLRSSYTRRGKENFAYLMDYPRKEGGLMRIEADEELAERAGVLDLMPIRSARGRWPKNGIPTPARCKWVKCSYVGYDVSDYQETVEVLTSLWRTCGE